MKVSVAVLSALVAVGLAKPAITNLSFNVQEGQPFTLEWIGATGPVTVELLSGSGPTTLTPLKTLATGETDGSFTFTPTGLPSGNYAFRVTDSTGENYGELFQYQGTAVSSSVTSSSRSASSTTSRSTSATSSAVTSSSSSESTTSSSSSTSTRTSATTSRTATSTPPANNNEGQRFSSPLALVFITVAALVFFN